MVRSRADRGVENTSIRRPHRKSRKGCKQCKQRHQKCDENRPTCVNCSTTDRQCSYLGQLLSPQTAAILQRQSSSDQSTPPSSLTASSPEVVEPAIRVSNASSQIDNADSPINGPVAQVFELGHLVLLHHLDTVVTRSPELCLMVTEDVASEFQEMIFKSAVASPYLMDELLAFSALHLSTLQADAGERNRYQHQAKQLQTRALMHFNIARQTVDDENCTSIFLFSSFLGMHLLFDATPGDMDFCQCLEKFVHFLNLHRGVRSVTRQSWHVISQTNMKMILKPIEAVDCHYAQLSAINDQCDRLSSLLASSGDSLCSVSLRACCAAVDSLRWILTQYSNLPKPYPTHIVLAWPLLIPSEYVDMLRQRRPEALVTLAHWAVLLHYERHFWLFRDSGRFLIESISRYLGEYWDHWMAWPNGVLNDV